MLTAHMLLTCATSSGKAMSCKLQQKEVTEVAECASLASLTVSDRKFIQPAARLHMLQPNCIEFIPLHLLSITVLH